MPSAPNARINAFFDFVRAQGLIPKRVLDEVQTYFAAPGDIRLGQVALFLGFLKPRDVLRIVADQVSSQMKFGEIALDMGLLTEEQLQRTLIAQSDRVTQALDMIRGACPIDEPTSAKLLLDFSDWLSREGEPSTEDPDLSAVRKTEADRIRFALKNVKKLATLPAVVQKALLMLDDPNVNLEKIGKLLEGDPPIAAQILRLSNSALYISRTRATTLQRAILVIGMTSVRQVIVSAAVVSSFKAGSPNDLRSFWFQSILTAHWARALASQEDVGVSPEEAFFGGLMADIGQLAIRQYFPEQSKQVTKLVAEGYPLATAERLALGIAHPDIGAYIANHWNFPASIEEAILYHQTPPSTLRQLKVLDVTRIVNAACRLAELTPDSQSMDLFAKTAEQKVDEAEFEGRSPFDLAPKVFEQTRELARVFL